LWLLIAAAAGVGLVYLFGKQPVPPIAAAPKTRPATLVSPATVPSPATQPVPVIQTYGQLLHADLANYPDTRPWAIPVNLSDAAHLILREPIYVCSRGDLWITRPDADPLPTVLARAAGESEHLVNRPIQYIIWSINRRGLWEPSAICRSGDGFEIVSATDTRPIPWHRAYRWDMAMTWIDGSATRLIVPTDAGVSIMTLGDKPSENYCRLLDSPAKDQQAIPPPRVLFDLRGLLAWIPADGDFAGAARTARYLDGKWVYLDSAAWPSNIIHLVPMLDGSVLQIRRGSDAGSAQLTIVPLDNPDIDEKEIAALTDQLGDDDPDKRVAAYQRLTQYGPGIYPILEKLSPNASPEAQARIRELLEGKLETKLGGLLINDNQLAVTARLPDGGVVFFASHGVSIPQEGQDPKIVSPDFLAVRPGRPVEELPPVVVDRLSKPDATIAGVRDEWVVSTPDVGPARYLPPDQLDPLLSPSERSFSRLLAIDGRGRWLFRDDASQRTLILDPTVPDPTPRLAIWLIDTGDAAGWSKADWPVIRRTTAHWLVNDHDFQPLDPSDEMRTVLPTPAPTTEPSLMTDTDGTRYCDGRMALTIVTAAGRKRTWPLPDACAGSTDQSPWLVGDRQGHLFLFNSTGRIARLRPTPTGAQPLVLEAVFGEHIPDFQDIRRIWCDPAGRIDVVYESSKLALIFPTGQVPPEIEDKILPQDLRRIDAP
jgi:hypothetical protein